jgi:hypothetical protein
MAETNYLQGFVFSDPDWQKHFLYGYVGPRDRAAKSDAGIYHNEESFS